MAIARAALAALLTASCTVATHAAGAPQPSKYAEARQTLEELSAALGTFVTDMEKAGGNEAMAACLNGFTDAMKPLVPRLKAMNERHPELASEATHPEELKPLLGQVDSRGRIWAGTVRGIAVLDPEQEVPDRSPKPLRLERTLLHGRAHPLAPGAALAHHENSLAFEYVLVAHFRDGDTRYRTQLVGLEPAPSDWTGDRKREFASLPAGRYAFRVWGRDHAGNVSGPLEAAFEIRPAPWRTWWALLLMAASAAALTGGVAYALARARLGRVLEMQRVRTGIATDLHDDIGASLTRISILSEVVKSRLGDSRPELLPPLTQVAEASRDLVDTMSDTVWSIDPGRDDLGSLVRRLLQFGADVFEGQGLAWEPRVPADAERVKLAPSQRRQLYLVLKEALANAARHSCATRVSFSLKVEEGRIRAEVADDGAGIDGSLEDAADRSRGGRGLRSMAERARQVGGTLSIDSRPGGGTRVRVELPLAPPRG